MEVAIGENSSLDNNLNTNQDDSKNNFKYSNEYNLNQHYNENKRTSTSNIQCPFYKHYQQTRNMNGYRQYRPYYHPFYYDPYYYDPYYYPPYYYPVHPYYDYDYDYGIGPFLGGLLLGELLL